MTMLLVADSGGTKTDWLLGKSGKELKSLQTRGLNPNVLDERGIICTLRKEIIPWLKGFEPSKVYFFGAGLGIAKNRHLLEKMIRSELKIAWVSAFPDMLGAAYAALGRQAGTIAILGTGSIAFCYDGKNIKKRYGGWGYLLGDEGGGVALGKTLVRAYLERRLPNNLADIYAEFIELKREDLLHEIYVGKRQNALLAAQSYFLAQHQNDPWVRELLNSQFTLFFKNSLAPCIEDFRLPAVLSGGIAETFFDLLIKLLRKKGLDEIRLLGSPIIKPLFEYVMAFAHKEIERKNI